MSRHSVMNPLRAYYDNKHISAINFVCPDEQSCKYLSTDFVPAREANIGPGYEAGTLPRILFISADAANEYPGRTPSRRTMDYQQQFHMKRGGDLCIKSDSPLWRETHLFAYEILNRVATRLGSTLNFGDICMYFACVNSAKCKTQKGSGQAKGHVFRNCQKYIHDEIVFLQPDIIITQGVYARKSISGKFQVRENLANNCTEIDIEGRPVLKFETIHPSVRDNTFRIEKEKLYPLYYDLAQKFLQSWTP